MYKILHMPGTLAILLLLTGCTSFQVEEAGRTMTVGLFEAVLDNALDKVPYEHTAHSRYMRDIAEREEEARRRDERERRHYEEEAKAIVGVPDMAEGQSGQLQPESTITDYERLEEERRSRRNRAFENMAEFDRFMQDLETAEEQNNDSRFDVSLINDSFSQSGSVIDYESAEKGAVNGPLTNSQ